MKTKLLSKGYNLLLASVIFLAFQIAMLVIDVKLAIWQEILAVIGIALLNSAVYYLACYHSLLTGFKRIFTRHGLKVMLKGWGLMILAVLVSGIVSKLLNAGIPENQQAIKASLSTTSPILMFMLGVISAALLEEVIFRGYLFGRFFGRSSRLGLVLSSLIFAYFHGPVNLSEWVVYASRGMVFAYLYYKYDHLEYSIALHFLNNGFGFVMAVFVAPLII